MCRNNEQWATSKGETWSRGTNSRLPFDVNGMLDHYIFNNAEPNNRDTAPSNSNYDQHESSPTCSSYKS